MHEGKLPPITEATSLGDVINGTRPGRESDEDRICFITGGLPVWDVGWGYEIYSKAKEMGLGVELKLWDSPYLNG
jgi:ornithine cyclodeaminase